MRQLSGLDAEFLAMESRSVFGHVGSVSPLDPATADGPFDLARPTGHLAARLHLVPVFPRRVVEVPFGLGHPYWVDDPDFSLDHHVRERYGNHVSAMLSVLPTDLGDPAEPAPPVLAGLGWRLTARLGLMQRINPWNLFVSNVPGPRAPLYYAGARPLAYFPLSALTHGQGLNVTVFSYADRLCFGLLVDRSLVPDPDRIAEALGDELAPLLAATAGTPTG